MRDVNMACAIESNSSAAALTVNASNTPSADECVQVVAFSGTSHDQAFTVTLMVAGDEVCTLHGAADTTQGMTFFGDGPVATNGGALQVETSCQAAPNTGQLTANLFYKTIY